MTNKNFKRKIFILSFSKISHVAGALLDDNIKKKCNIDTVIMNSVGPNLKPFENCEPYLILLIGNNYAKAVYQAKKKNDDILYIDYKEILITKGENYTSITFNKNEVSAMKAVKLFIDLFLDNVIYYLNPKFRRIKKEDEISKLDNMKEGGGNESSLSKSKTIPFQSDPHPNEKATNIFEEPRLGLKPKEENLDKSKPPLRPNSENTGIIAQKSNISSNTPIKQVSKSPIPPTPDYEYSKAFYCSGEKIWTIKFDGKTRNLRQKHGLRYIHHILSNPGKEISFDELYKIIYPSASLSDIGNFDYKTKEEHNKGIPLNNSSLEGFSRYDLERRLNENRKEIKRLKSVNDELNDEVEKQTPKFEDSKSKWKNLKLDEQMKRDAGKLNTVTQKMKAHTLVETAHSIMTEIEKKIDDNKTRIQSNKAEISAIGKINNQIALQLNNGWGEHTKEYDNVRTTIYHNIDDCLESIQNQGLNSFIRYWRSFVDYKEGVYQYTPENGSESWKLDI